MKSVQAALRITAIRPAFLCVLAGILAGAFFLSTRSVASPPPPPPKQIRVIFIDSPHGNYMGASYVMKVKLWYNDALVYDGSSAFRQDYPDGLSSSAFHPGGNLKSELTLADTSGRVLATQSTTTSRMFDGGTKWTLGQVFTPDRKHSHSWLNVVNHDINGYLQLQFRIQETGH